MAAKESWLANDVPAARAILGRAFAANPESEGIWLAAIKLEAENGQIEAARQLMERARDVAATERVRPLLKRPLPIVTDTRAVQIWLKSAVFERQHGTLESSLATAKQGLTHYPSCAKLHMLHGQLLLSQKPLNTSAVREAFAIGLKKCPTAVPMWIMSSRLEEQVGMRIKARALLEKARSLNPKSEELWLEIVKVEERDGSGAAKGMLARGSSFLVSHRSRTNSFSQLSKLSLHQALSTRTPSGPNHARRARVVPSTLSRRPTTLPPSSSPSPACSGANARSRKRATGSLAPSLPIRISETPGRGGTGLRRTMGTPYVGFSSMLLWNRLLMTCGAQDHRETVVAKCVEADPHHGPVWQAILKDPKNVGKDLRQVLVMAAEVVDESANAAVAV